VTHSRQTTLEQALGTLGLTLNTAKKKWTVKTTLQGLWEGGVEQLQNLVSQAISGDEATPAGVQARSFHSKMWKT